MIKVLHLIKSLGRGGAEVLLSETLKLHQQGYYEFHYIYFLPWKNQMVANLEDSGGKVVCIPANNNASIILQYKKVAQYIIQNKITLIHSHLPVTGILGRILHELYNHHVIYTEHNRQERYHFLTRQLNKLTFNFQSHAIAVSSDVEHSIRYNIRPKIKIKTILNGVNTQEFNREITDVECVKKRLGYDESNIVIGTIAVFRTQKRLREWLHVFKKIQANYPQTRGILVGDGPLRFELEETIKNFDLQDVVYLAGLQKNVKPWLAAMDIFMMSSEFEGLPVALLEAMSMQCAIVSTDAGGIKEVIRNDIDGFVVPVVSWSMLTVYLEHLISSPDLLHKMKTNARLRVQSEFSLAKMVFKLEELYNSISGGNT